MSKFVCGSGKGGYRSNPRTTIAYSQFCLPSTSVHLAVLACMLHFVLVVGALEAMIEAGGKKNEIGNQKWNKDRERDKGIEK